MNRGSAAKPRFINNLHALKRLSKIDFRHFLAGRLRKPSKPLKLLRIMQLDKRRSCRSSKITSELSIEIILLTLRFLSFAYEEAIKPAK